ERIFQTLLLIKLRRAVALEPAAHKQFVESIEPPEAARLRHRHEMWMHRPLDGRPPSDLLFTGPRLPDPHPTRRQDHEREHAIVDNDFVHAFGEPASQRPLADEISVGRPAYVIRPNSELIDLSPRRDIGDHVILFHGRSNPSQRRTEQARKLTDRGPLAPVSRKGRIAEVLT